MHILISLSWLFAFAGHYCPDFGTIQPVPCPPGSWADAPRQIECQRDNKTSCCPDNMAELFFAWKSLHSAVDLQSQLCPSGWTFTFVCMLLICFTYSLFGDSKSPLTSQRRWNSGQINFIFEAVDQNNWSLEMGIFQVVSNKPWNPFQPQYPSDTITIWRHQLFYQLFDTNCLLFWSSYFYTSRN